MNSVAIIGAGPGGLVAAAKLLQSSEFSVTIFEKSSSVGGLWSEGGLINPEMQTNLSKFTVCFSDQSWDSVDLERHVGLYPKAWQVNQYLKRYVDEFIPLELIRFNTEVIKIEKKVSGRDQTTQWKLITTPTHSTPADTSEAVFDYLVAAPGFSSIPFTPNAKIQSDIPSDNTIPVIHSTQFRTLADIFPNPAILGGKRKKVLVVGGSHSGSEAAVSLALQMSNARYAPPEGQNGAYTDTNCDIIHLTSRRMYALPALIRNDTSKTCAFQPFDFKLYNRSNRPADPVPSFTVGLVNPQKLEAGKRMIKSLLEGTSELSKNEEADDLPPYAVISEAYNQLLHSKQIKPLLGTLEGLKGAGESALLSATIQINEDKDHEFELGDIAAVVYATGFDIVPALNFMSAEVKNLLEFDESCSTVPLLLDSSYLSANQSVPELAIIGYSGSYWGFLEMQARATVARWTTKNAKLGESVALTKYFRDLKMAVKDNRKAQVAQNPFNDYVGLMEQAAWELGLRRVDMSWISVEGPITPARFTDAGADIAEAEKTVKEIQVIQRCSAESGLFAARAVFHGLLGKWTVERQGLKIDQHSIELDFHPRLPTAVSVGWEYLTIQKYNVHEVRTVYRYDETKDEITIWAVDSEDNLSTSQPLCSLWFNLRDTEADKDTVVAEKISVDTTQVIHAPHRFTFSGALLQSFTKIVSQNEDAPCNYRFTRPS
jgi:hypothetical protein